MKKNMMKVAFVAAFAMIASYGVNNAEQSEMMSDLMVANVEALAEYSRAIELPCIVTDGTCTFKFKDAEGKYHNGEIEGMKNPD